MLPTNDLVVLTGEPSGDLLGSLLVEQLLIQQPRVRVAAVAGPRLRALGVECVEPMESLQVMGFVDVALALPRLARVFYALRRWILAKQPKAVVGIDYPGMHLKLYADLRKRGYKGKLIHYVCPSVWAWKKGRIATMAKSLDLLLTTLPFEPACFAGSGLRAEYVGHPLVRSVREARGDFPPGKWLALFPGSRRHEIERNLPLMLRVAERLQREDPALRIAISVASAEREALVRKLAGDVLCVAPAQSYALMRAAHLALAKSGTVTLELALHGTPTVVQYAIGALDVFLAQRVLGIRLPHYALPNIVVERAVFPELFGPQLSEETLWNAARGLWFEETQREACRAGCREVAKALGERDASAEAAQWVLGTLNAGAAQKFVSSRA